MKNPFKIEKCKHDFPAIHCQPKEAEKADVHSCCSHCVEPDSHAPHSGGCKSEPKPEVEEWEQESML